MVVNLHSVSICLQIVRFAAPKPTQNQTSISMQEVPTRLLREKERQSLLQEVPRMNQPGFISIWGYWVFPKWPSSEKFNDNYFQLNSLEIYQPRLDKSCPILSNLSRTCFFVLEFFLPWPKTHIWGVHLLSEIGAPPPCLWDVPLDWSWGNLGKSCVKCRLPGIRQATSVVNFWGP